MSRILIWETLSEIGGGQEMTLKVADILKEHHQLHFLIPQEGELSQQLNIRDIPYTLMGDQSMPKGVKGFKGLVKFLYLTVFMSIKGRKAVKVIKPDFLYAAGPASLVWSAICAKKSTKVIWHLHHNFQSGATLKLINFFSAFKCVKRIISVSDYVGKQIKNKNAQHKKLTIYNPITPLSPDVERKNLCDEFENLDRDLKVAQIGFITPTKNQHITLDIISWLKKTGYDVSLAIIGSVREADIHYKKLLDKKIIENDLLDNVVFTGYRRDVLQIISTFDVVVLPSVEGFPLVAMQAIIEKVPVLTVDNSGGTELVQNTSCGMIYSSHSSTPVIADTLIKTASIDIETAQKKHSEFLFSECSYENFSIKIRDLFFL